MVASTLIAVVLLGAAARTAAGCGNAMDCSLNGDCTKNGCVCDAPWAGASCGRLLRFPAKPGGAYGFGKRFETTSWGGNSLKGDDGLWHLYVTECVPHPRIADRTVQRSFYMRVGTLRVRLGTERGSVALEANVVAMGGRNGWLLWASSRQATLYLLALAPPPAPFPLLSLSPLSRLGWRARPAGWRSGAISPR